MTMTMTTSAPPAAVRSRRQVHPPTAPSQTGQSSTSSVSINLLLAAVLGLAIIVTLVGFGGNAAANSPLVPVSADSEIVDAIEVYVVQPGDTLWAIASEVARPGEDIRPIVDQLKELTGGSQLEIGQRIVIDHTTIRG